MAEIIITGHHTVKPSSPTPLASKIHKISFIDQIAPQVYIPLIFFYKNDESNHMQQNEISRRLKQSLSEILSIFYPLAGTLNHNSFVDCNDRGAEFVEARVHARLQEFIENPKMEELKQLQPADSSSYDNSATLMSVKTTFFNCGGFSVGLCLSHKVADGGSAVAFMNAWGATCRGEEASRIIHPSFDLALHFPPRDLPPSASGFSVGITEEKIVTKRLVFEREKVEKLRKEASIGEIKNPSRVEAVSVFIWRCFIEASEKSTETTSFAATHAVNLRPRAVPPIPDHTFGNCVTPASAIISPEEYEGGNIGVLVSKLRAAIRGVDDHYINSIVNDDDAINSLTNETGDMFRSGNCLFSSWWRFPVYEVDFGWGRPVWVCTTTGAYMNSVILMDNPSRDGVEAWISVPNQHFFEIFQHNYNVLSNSYPFSNPTSI